MVSRHEDVGQSSPTGGHAPQSWLEDTISHDPALDPVLPQIRRLAASDAPVLIIGEPGSGRELVARAIHNLSGRAAQPFVLLDCASLSEPLIDAEMLGVDGTFGGKPQRKIGVVEQAGHGTALLAEVGELPSRLQDALLRVLERHELVRLNSDEPISVAARAFATTSVDLRERVAAGLFRDDLHVRLATEVLSLPPLRERAGDVPVLARHFVTQLGRATRDFAPDAEALLRDYPWPGNLRELREVVELAALHARGDRIAADDLPDRLRTTSEKAQLPSLRDVEMRHIERVLQEARGNQRRASRILGISRWSLSRRLRKYGMHARGGEE